MVAVYFGTDVYGAVARVDKTTIATKFAMLQFLPIWPQASYYYGGMSAPEGENIPFVFTDQSAQIIGLPLVRRHWPSIIIAYVRGIAGALFLLSCIPLIGFAVMWLSGEKFKSDQQMIVATAGLIFVVGATLGALSYLLAPRASRRDAEIRRYCATVLGLAADPAMLESSAAQHILQTGRESYRKNLSEVPRDGLAECTDYDLCLLLVLTRAECASCEQSSSREEITDCILGEARRRRLAMR